MNKEEIKIKEFDKEQLEILLNDLQDIDKFTGFKDGAFKYELGKYQASLLVNCIKKQKELIDKAIDFIKIYRSYQKIDNKDYLKGRDEIGCLDICQVDELLKILKGVK